MNRRGQITTFQERVEIVERATAGESDATIASGLRAGHGIEFACPYLFRNVVAR